jgi:hypothetical protein
VLIPVFISGIVIATACNPLFLRHYIRAAKKLGRQPPPEAHLVKGLYGAIICPIALFGFAFTTYSTVHWIVPIIFSIPFGFGMFVFYPPSSVDCPLIIFLQRACIFFHLHIPGRRVSAIRGLCNGFKLVHAFGASSRLPIVHDAE